MKSVAIKRIEIENFKGISLFAQDFDAVYTAFEGRNGSGKSSLYDAYMWVMTGFNSEGQANFKVQPVDKNNVTIPKLVTRVKVVFDVDGTQTSFERRMSQKWTKPRGTNTEILNGNESTYFVNEIPMKNSEYNEAIESTIGEVNLIKMVSSVYSFFNLSVQERRKMLMNMAGELPDILTPQAYPNLYKKYVVTKSVDGAKKQAQFAIKELNAKLDAIPNRKSENERNLPTGIDFDWLRIDKQEIEQEIADIDSELTKTADSRSEYFDRINKVKAEIGTMEVNLLRIENAIADGNNRVEMEYKKKLSEIDLEVMKKSTEVKGVEFKVAQLKKQLEMYEKKIAELGNKWREVNRKTFEAEIATECPTCGHQFTEDEMSEKYNALVEAFNKGKVGTLDTIAKEGNGYAEMKRTALSEIAVLEESLSLLESQKKTLVDKKNELVASHQSPEPVSVKCMQSDEYQSLSREIDAKKQLLQSMTDESRSSYDSELSQKKQTLRERLESVIRQLAKEDMIAVVEKRRKELDEEAVLISQQIAENEAVVNEAREYAKAHIMMVEDNVSSMFSVVKFQMYEPNLTNDGEKEICECLIDGVPYSSNLNSASKVNAGIDVINAISMWNKTLMPIWIDNKETVTDLLPSPSQVITLSVKDNVERLERVK